MANISLTWDPMPAGEAWKEVRIYESGTQIGKVAMPATSVALTATRATHTYTARSFDGIEESVDSNAVTWAPPVPPGHLRR